MHPAIHLADTTQVKEEFENDPDFLSQYSVRASTTA